jgi:hypothetical protein
LTGPDIDAREIRAMLQGRVPELLHRLFPQYGLTLPVFTPLNPTRADKRPGSFVIWTAGAAIGGFNEYSPAGPPASGDVIDLIAYVHNRPRDRRFALAWARDFLGIQQMDPAALAKAKQKARAAAAQAVQQQSDAARRKVEAAHRIWNKTLPLAGSLAETYLASRRIPYMLIPNRGEDLRFIPNLEHWKSAKWDGDRKVNDGPHLPAMVGALRNLAGELTAVHCTFLRADGSGKADVPDAKLMRGIAKGSAIWLTRGGDGPGDDSRSSVQEALQIGEIATTIVAEGIETALSVAMGVPEARVAAAGSFDLMLALDVTGAIFDPVIYALDNDGDARHEDLLRDRLEDLRSAGKRAGTMRSHDGKDFNDLM